MSDSGASLPARRVETLPASTDVFVDAPAGPNPLQTLHGWLRGRYHWAVLLAIALGALGGYLAHRSFEPRFRSTGYVRVVPIVPRVLYESEENETMPMFDAYVNAQVALLRSQRVAERALESPEWQQLDRPRTQSTVDLYRGRLGASRDRGSQLIRVHFDDDEPDAAIAGVTSAIKAYMEIYGDQDRRVNDRRLSLLESHRSSLISQIHGLKQRILEVADEFGTSDLESILSFKISERQKLETKLKEIETTIATLGIEDDEEQDKAGNVQLSAGQIAKVDRTMEGLLRRRNDAEVRAETLALHHRPNHPTRAEADRQLLVINELIAQRVEEYNDSNVGIEVLHNQLNVQAQAVGRLRQLKRQREALRSLYESAHEESLEIGRRKVQIDSLRDQIVELDRRLTATEQRLEQLNVESAMAGRISVYSYGDRPGQPINLGRRNQRVALATGGGLFAGFAVVALLGCVSRRYRYVEEAHYELAQYPVLGVLPRLPERFDRPEQAAAAAQSVQRIRAMLQLRTPRAAAGAITVTSAAPGDGKTSLVLALGLCFAASRCRTLMIDFDLHGRGLTGRVDRMIRRRIGQILMEQSLITADQLDAGLEVSRKSGQRLGEALCSLGYLGEDDLHRAVRSQERSARGLAHAVAGDPLHDCVADVGPPRLFILPACPGQSTTASQLAPGEVAALLERARRDFDVVLIDTGPVLSALEAPMMARQSDHVLFTVSAGHRRDLTRHAIGELEHLGVEISGIVFNRANRRDLKVYPSSSYSGVAPQPAHNGNGHSGLPDRFGPVARATALYLSEPGKDDEAHEEATP